MLASRKWRQGVKTFIFLDEPLDPARAPPGLMEGIRANDEIYDHFPQPNSRPGTWSQPGDARLALSPSCTDPSWQWPWLCGCSAAPSRQRSRHDRAIISVTCTNEHIQQGVANSSWQPPCRVAMRGEAHQDVCPRDWQLLITA